MHLPTKFAVAATTALFMSGCAAITPELPAPPASVDQTVEMGLTSFMPETIRITQGQTVQWRNTSVNEHTVTADPALVANPANVELPPGAETFHSGGLEPGATWQKTFSVPGTYRYVCLPHEQLGMTGTIVVEPQ